MQINYCVNSGQIGDTGDYWSSITIFKGDREIGYAGEMDELHIAGDFRIDVETGWDKDIDVPILENRDVVLTVDELRILHLIMLWWVKESIDEPLKYLRPKEEKKP
jgi:hypothetical protein